MTSLALGINDIHLSVGLRTGGMIIIDIVSGITLRQLELPSLTKPIESLSLIEYENK